MVERFLVALALVGLVDAMSYMAVTPSLIFYVLEVGGNKEQYGIIMSAFSFASFCAKPFLGHWSDAHGFRLPYSIALCIASLGGVLYFFASAFHGMPAVAMIFAGRILGGVGSGSATLAFAYMAKAVPHDRQTQINSTLSMVRILGMAAGPGLNVVLGSIDTTWYGLTVNKLNSVGILLVTANLLALAVILNLLEEPSVDYSVHHAGDPSKKRGWKTVFKSLFCLAIIVPILSIFTFNANFQLIETGFAPAAYHALGWGPVQTSAVLGSISVIILCMMFVVFELSRFKVRDEFILAFGLVVSIVGYTMMWMLWVAQAAAWKFILPIVCSASAFPFLAAPTRSLFTKAVDNIEFLDGHQGTMQAVLSMAASVAGFTAPSLVAAFVLRHPTVVDSAMGQRELSSWALAAPTLSGIVLVGVALIQFGKGQRAGSTDGGASTDEIPPNEKTELLEQQPEEENVTENSLRRFNHRHELHRQDTAKCMGIAQGNTHLEHHEHYYR